MDSEVYCLSVCRHNTAHLMVFTRHSELMNQTLHYQGKGICPLIHIFTCPSEIYKKSTI